MEKLTQTLAKLAVRGSKLVVMGSVLVLPPRSQAASVRQCSPLCVELMARLTQTLARQAVRGSKLVVMESVLALSPQSPAASVRQCFPLCVELMDKLTQTLVRLDVRGSKLDVKGSVLVSRRDDLCEIKVTCQLQLREAINRINLVKVGIVRTGGRRGGPKTGSSNLKPVNRIGCQNFDQVFSIDGFPKQKRIMFVTSFVLKAQLRTHGQNY